MTHTFVLLVACLYGLTALGGATGFWLAWPVTEGISAGISILALRKYRNRYAYY